ncbi:peptidoglycan-binding domain-containing protein [Kitasatospora sp. NPDC028055]|uniref:peptidoglycan-binding domain-containing protein n=1 Tax=Kitasatospora sp. NPDC028055 TaxID=3155653 RepID=UPI0033D3DFE5
MISNLFKRGAVTAGAAFLAVSVFGGVAHADPGVPYIKPSQRGDAVACVQMGLRDAGYNIDVDGKYGTATYTALTDFQANRSLQPDGIVGPRTGDRLYFDYLAKSGNVTQSELCATLIPTTR